MGKKFAKKSNVKAEDKKVYGFQEQLEIGTDGQDRMDKFFSSKYSIDPPDDVQQEIDEGWDRRFTCKKTGEKCLIEYKTDEKAKTTGNFFIETISNTKNHKLGWLFWSEAHRVMILVGSTIHSFKLDDLREYMIHHGKKYKGASCQNRGYTSLGWLMPIKDAIKLESYQKTEMK